MDRRAFKNTMSHDCGGRLHNKWYRWAGRWARDSLDIDVGADNILNLLGKWILEGEGAGSNPDPLSGFRAESVHD